MQENYDLIIRGGTIFDGSGQPGFKAALAIQGERIAAIGALDGSVKAKKEIDASGKAVAPGFINVMSSANQALMIDGRSMSDIRQGVTLEVFGEGHSEGPLNPSMKAKYQSEQTDIKFDVTWNTLGEFLDTLQARGVATNIASYVGAASLRIYAVGYDNRPATSAEMDIMRRLMAEAMEEGAMGVSSALIYPPGAFADTAELVELSKVAAKYGGIYISHLRSEGEQLMEAVEELITIAREAKIRAEIYHLKAVGVENWQKMDQLIARVDKARAEGMQISADMYTYTAGGTGLSAAMPPWVQEGGREAFMARLKDPQLRQKLIKEMSTVNKEWENLYLAAGSGKNVLLSKFRTEALKPLQGKTLAEVAEARGKSEVETIIDLIVEDNSRVEAIYFHMTEDNLKKQMQCPWICLGSDGSSHAAEGIFLKMGVHPRVYGNFARFLAKYVRDEGVLPLGEAIRRMTSLPAENLCIKERGKLTKGYFADVVVFDPQTIQDHATFQQSQQYATGVSDVIVNGQLVLENGEHTGATPGQVVRGPGWKKK
jgi:N-acyl-D-amino-acid deacylase